MVPRVSGVTLLTLISLLLLDDAHSAAIRSGISGRDEAEVVSFMMQYGYLEPKNPRLGEFRTKEDLENGIKQLQQFGNLKVTGRIDAETVKLIKMPRCSMPDFGPSDNMKRRRKRYALHNTEWRKHHLTYRLLNTSTEELSKREIRVALRRAFDMWSQVSPLTFEEIWAGEAEIRISFESRIHHDGFPFDGRGGKIAHGFYPDMNINEDGDIHFDDEEHWTLDKPKTGTDFMWTAVHEIGHALGVDHSTYWDAIMYPFYTGYKPDIKLHDDDIMAIQAKYGKPPVPTFPPTNDLSFTGPTPCNETSFDAVFHSKDGNTYFFKHLHFWTLDKYNRIIGAKKIVDFWPKLRAKIQAAYTRRDGKTVFFKGRRYWIFEGTKYIDGPNLISAYGLPLELKRLDAVFTWAANGKTYFFKGDKYWRYNEQLKKLDPGYPKNISDAWGRTRHPVDSVMTWKDGNSYFFKGQSVSKFEFHKWNVYKPEKIAKIFFNCSEPQEDSVNVVTKLPEKKQEEIEEPNNVSRTTMFVPLMALLAIVASICSH